MTPAEKTSLKADAMGQLEIFLDQIVEATDQQLCQMLRAHRVAMMQVRSRKLAEIAQQIDEQLR